MDLTDSIAESVAEAGNLGYSLIHPGHGALEFGLSAEEDIGLSPSSLPSSLQGLMQKTHLSQRPCRVWCRGHICPELLHEQGGGLLSSKQRRNGSQQERQDLGRTCRSVTVLSKPKENLSA